MKRNKPDKISAREAFNLNLRSIKIWWKQSPFMFLSIAAHAIVSALTPYVGLYLSARILDELASSRRPEALLTLVLVTLLSTAGLTLLKAALEKWRNYQTVGQVWVQREKLYADKLLSMDFCSLDDPHTHELLSMMRQNVNWYGWGISSTIWSLEEALKALMQILGSVALTVSLFTQRVSMPSLYALNSPLFALLCVFVLLGVTLFVPMLSNKSQAYWASCAEEAREGNRKFGFYGFRVSDKKRALDTRVYRQEAISKKGLLGNGTFGLRGPMARLAHGPMGLLMAASAAVSHVFTGLVYMFVCLKALGGAFSVGAVTQYIGAITLLSGGLTAFLSALGKMRNNTAFLRPAFEFFDIENPMYQGSLTIEKRTDRKYEIEFKDVSFKYPGSDAWALQNVSLKFRIGRRLAVVGQNGSGKTTFIKLLCRLYDPTEGEILLNGIDIRKYDYQEYLSIFSVVFQDFQLFALPLKENVAASQSPDCARVEACLKKAGFLERLNEMPLGMDTYLYKNFDEAGIEISGGEAQKLAIARALYKDAPFLVMDEPTAALDPVAEYEVYAKLNDIVGDKTAIFISHRLSSCRFCDEIAVFDQGHLVQKGGHDALVKEESGKYHALWFAQAQYYLEEGLHVPGA